MRAESVQTAHGGAAQGAIIEVNEGRSSRATDLIPSVRLLEEQTRLRTRSGG